MAAPLRGALRQVLESLGAGTEPGQLIPGKDAVEQSMTMMTAKTGKAHATKYRTP